MASRQFDTLNGARGIAALAVVFGHSFSRFGGYVPGNTALAVDFFFVLSGFVLAFAYDRRLQGQWRPAKFMLVRAVRLYPLFLLGLGIGLVAFLPIAIRDGQLASWMIAAVVNSLMLPAPASILFPYDAPAWSLFFEFWVANLLWAVMWHRLHGGVLAALITISAAFLAAVTIYYPSLDVGYTWPTLSGGFARVLFSFFLGIALARYRANHPPRFRMSPLLVIIALAVALLLPPIGKLYQAGCVFLLFPWLVYVGSAEVERKMPIFDRLGDLSYALYATHWAPLIIAGVALRNTGGLAAQVGVTAFLAILALAGHHADCWIRSRTWLTRLTSR